MRWRKSLLDGVNVTLSVLREKVLEQKKKEKLLEEQSIY